MKNIDKEDIVITDNKNNFVFTIKKGSGWICVNNRITFYDCEMRSSWLDDIGKKIEEKPNKENKIPGAGF